MNFWTGLILGIIIGWLVEWIIDWLFWRRDDAAPPDEAAFLTERAIIPSEAEWSDRLATAETDYHQRLAAVEAEWQERLNLNEQQWQSQFAAVEADRESLRARLVDTAAVSTLAAAGVVALNEPADDETILTAPEGDEFAAPTDLPAAEDTHDPFDTREFGFVIAGDDLTRIHGIGPRYASLLADGGIHSYDDLAATDPEQLRAIINPGPMQQINFGSWTAQATAFAAVRGSARGDDLTTLEGIGPVYAARLNERGITTFAGLAAADEATLADIIAAPAWRRINYGDWIAQSRLAAAGDTTGLQELQGRLFRREGDNLNLIRGLGQRSAAGLRAAGIDTFAALATATPEQIEAAVRAGGGRGGDYAAWIDEAATRAAGRRVARVTRRPKAAYVVSCPQDLSAVHGIGSVFEQRLYAAGIGSYWELAELADDELLSTLGARAGSVDLPAIKAEAMRLAVAGNAIGRAWDGTPPDDFEQLGGIGEIYERRLYEAGICTFAALAATTPERLAEICQAPHLRTPDYAAWIAHAAELAGRGAAES